MNETETALKERLEQRGFEVLRNGWPDFLCIRKDGYSADFIKKKIGVVAVEVKSRTEKVEPHQTKVHKILRAVGLPVFVLRPQDDVKYLRTSAFLTESDREAALKRAGDLQEQIDRLQQQLDLLSDIAAGTRTLVKEQTPLLELLESNDGQMRRVMDKYAAQYGVRS